MSSWKKASAMLFASTATALVPCISTTSWGDPRLDVFGVTDDLSLWHKFYTGWDWQPAGTGAGSVERIPAALSGGTCPAVSSWGEGRLDIVYVDEDDKVRHKYFGGGAWGPSWEGAGEDLGHGEAGAGALATASWGDERLDIVVWSHEGSYSHKAWTGEAWFPEGEGWEDLGGDFGSAPAVVSWGAGRLDVVGISAENGSLLHRYYQQEDGDWSAWEDLGGGPFVGNPGATSWGPGRLDVWAVSAADGQLRHLYWDGHQYKGWESLGGSFVETPKVAHWAPGKIDIVGWAARGDSHYRLKSFDGESWSDKWHTLAGPFATEPALSAKKGTNFLYVFGITEAEELRMQIWTGYDWQPGHDQTWPMGSLNVPESAAAAEANGAPARPAFTSEQAPLEL